MQKNVVKTIFLYKKIAFFKNKSKEVVTLKQSDITSFL